MEVFFLNIEDLNKNIYGEIVNNVLKSFEDKEIQNYLSFQNNQIKF